MESIGENLIFTFKESGILMSEDLEEILGNRYNQELNVQKVAMYYQILNMFKHKNLGDVMLNYINRCLTVVSKTNNFSELNIHHLSKILASSELHITSEFEVYNEAYSLVDYNYKERCKFAEDVLLKIRVPLLPESVYKNIQNAESSWFSSVGKSEKSLIVIDKIN